MTFNHVIEWISNEYNNLTMATYFEWKVKIRLKIKGIKLVDKIISLMSDMILQGIYSGISSRSSMVQRLRYYHRVMIYIYIYIYI